MPDERLQGAGEYRTTMRILDMTTEAEKQKTIKCALGGICSEHPHTLERVAILEQALKDMKGINEGVLVKLDRIRDVTMEELQNMRKDIQEGILKRYPGGIVLTVSILTGLVGIFATGLITLMVTMSKP